MEDAIFASLRQSLKLAIIRVEGAGESRPRPPRPVEVPRVGTPSNREAFAKTFGAKAGETMVRQGDAHIVIW